jgi:hypothetical protein
MVAAQTTAIRVTRSNMEGLREMTQAFIVDERPWKPRRRKTIPIGHAGVRPACSGSPC